MNPENLRVVILIREYKVLKANAPAFCSERLMISESVKYLQVFLFVLI